MANRDQPTYRTIRNLRLGFASLTLLLLFFGAVSAWHSWVAEKEHEQLYLSTIVKITGNSISSYFDQYERALAGLGQTLPRNTSPESLHRAHQLLKQFRQANPQLARLTLGTIDGRRLLADDQPFSTTMPEHADLDAFQQTMRQLDGKPKLIIEKAKKSVFDQQWIIPLRYPLQDADGQYRLVLSAILPVSEQQSFWRDVPLPSNAAFGLLRDDGFILSRYPVPTKINYDELYGKPRDGKLVDYLRQYNFPQRGVTEGYNSVAKADYLFAFHRLAHYPLTVFVSTPISNLEEKWLAQAQFSLWLSALLLFGGYAIFRWSVSRQLIWEKERDMREETIAFLAQHDALTNLPNRLLAKDRLQQAVAYADRAQAKVALLFLDLDNFKAINDALGHSVGDALLQQVAMRLQGCLRETDTLSRQGGDEFLIILADIREAGMVLRVTQAINEALSAVFRLDEHDLTSTASIGIAIYPDDGHDQETLLKKADTAMYHAKAAGRNTYRFFTEAMNQQADQGLRMRGWLRHALEHDEFVLHYQPQLDLGSGTVIGAEALIRLNQGGSELIAPGRFIGVAEDSGLIVPIGNWVLRAACRQAAAWRQAGMTELVMAVNISAIQFRRGDLEQSVITALTEAGLPPSALELELTESILIEGTEQVLDIVRRLQAIGVRFSIDDFGTGYSSLAYLKRFNVDKLKIDQSFVRDMVDDPDDAAIVRALIQMSHSLNIKTIAEGIEDEATRALLASLRCDEGQGYLFARPLPADDFARYFTRILAERAPLPPASQGATIIPLPPH